MLPLFHPKVAQQIKGKISDAFRLGEVSQQSIYTAAIYVAPADVKAADYLKDLLALIFREVKFEDRFSNQKNNPVDFYFALIPERFEEIYTNKFSLRNDIIQAIERRPKCVVFFVHTHESAKRNSSILADEINQQTSRLPRDIYICPPLRDFLRIKFSLARATNLTGSKAMSEILKPSSLVTDIMTDNDVLLTAYQDSKFSEVFFKVNGLGVSHIPILKSSQDEKCVRILSRRDIVKRIPPARIPEEIATKYGINRGKLVGMIAKLGNQQIQSLFPSEQNVIFADPSLSIKGLIEKLTTKHLIGDDERYISGLPVRIDDKSNELEGFVSFRDVLKKFISIQPQEFLGKKIRDIATIPSDYEEVIRMTDSDDLSFADSMFETGIRSLPIVEGSYDSDELWGFVDEIKMNIYKHEAFTNNLASLECKYFATPASALRIIDPDESIGDCLSAFWEKNEGASAPASFVVGDKNAKKANGDSYKDAKLLGVLSYIDILRAWRRWSPDK
jgi:CBS domain-containing protein